MGLTREVLQRRRDERLVTMLKIRANRNPKGSVIIVAELLLEAARRLEELALPPRSPWGSK